MTTYKQHILQNGNLTTALSIVLRFLFECPTESNTNNFSWKL